jgi:hypothetical protein
VNKYFQKIGILPSGFLTAILSVLLGCGSDDASKDVAQLKLTFADHSFLQLLKEEDTLSTKIIVNTGNERCVVEVSKKKLDSLICFDSTMDLAHFDVTKLFESSASLGDKNAFLTSSVAIVPTILVKLCDCRQISDCEALTLQIPQLGCSQSLQQQVNVNTLAMFNRLRAKGDYSFFVNYSARSPILFAYNWNRQKLPRLNCNIELYAFKLIACSGASKEYIRL